MTKAMTKSEIFTTANAMARATKYAFGDYKIALREALKTIYAFLAEGRTGMEAPKNLPADADRRVRSRRVLTLLKFEGYFVEQWIKENSRIKREIPTSSRRGILINEEYFLAKQDGIFGEYWEEDGKFYAYEYFTEQAQAIRAELAMEAEAAAIKAAMPEKGLEVLIGKSVSLDFGNKEIEITVTSIEPWTKEVQDGAWNYVRNYINFEVNHKSANPLRKLYEAVEGGTSFDSEITVDGRRFGYEFGFCDSKTKRKAVDAAVKELLSNIIR